MFCSFSIIYLTLFFNVNLVRKKNLMCIILLCVLLDLFRYVSHLKKMKTAGGPLI